jgi:hypothetical protein
VGTSVQVVSPPNSTISTSYLGMIGEPAKLEPAGPNPSITIDGNRRESHPSNVVECKSQFELKPVDPEPSITIDGNKRTMSALRAPRF